MYPNNEITFVDNKKSKTSLYTSSRNIIKKWANLCTNVKL